MDKVLDWVGHTDGRRVWPYPENHSSLGGLLTSQQIYLGPSSSSSSAMRLVVLPGLKIFSKWPTTATIHRQLHQVSPTRLLAAACHTFYYGKCSSELYIIFYKKCMHNWNNEARKSMTYASNALALRLNYCLGFAFIQLLTQLDQSQQPRTIDFSLYFNLDYVFIKLMYERKNFPMSNQLGE